jgi:inosose dehydratase
MNYGCQTYTWQMSYSKHAGQLGRIIETVGEAGYRGLEAEVCMLGYYYDHPSMLEEALERAGLKLAALTLALPWLHSKETEDERSEADKLLHYMRHFPGTLLVLVPLPGQDRSNLAERQRRVLQCVNAVSQRAHAEGIASALHPNSPPGSVFRTEEDYKVMFAGLDREYVGYAPDSGHIANGGMDPLSVFEQQMPLIRHVHFKDISIDKEWRAMGEGVIDHPAILKLLKDHGYKGWVIVEEESEDGAKDPWQAALRNGEYMKREWRRL